MIGELIEHWVVVVASPCGSARKRRRLATLPVTAAEVDHAVGPDTRYDRVVERFVQPSSLRMPPTRPFDHRVVAYQGKVPEALDIPQREVVLDPGRCGPLGETRIVRHTAAELDQECALSVSRTIRFLAPYERLQMLLEQDGGNASGLGPYQSEPDCAREFPLLVRRWSRAYFEQSHGLVPGRKRHLAMRSRTVVHCLQSGQTRRALS